MFCEKTNNILCRLLHSIILVGVILFFIGLYYWGIKAGIPYQDPTLEMQLEYAVNTKIGETLLANGFWIAVCGEIIHLILKFKNIKEKNTI